MNPDNIKQWLKDSGHDRQWLAKKCSVSKSTVDGWLSPNGARNIPKPSQSIIADLMYKEKPIEPRFTVEQYARIQKAARDAGLEVDTWIEKTIISALVLAIGSFAAFHLARSDPDFSAHSLAASARAGICAACAFPFYSRFLWPTFLNALIPHSGLPRSPTPMAGS